jgi:hypothetical protein
MNGVGKSRGVPFRHSAFYLFYGRNDSITAAIVVEPRIIVWRRGCSGIMRGTIFNSSG